MIIDCHTHLYPDEVRINPHAWALQRNELYWADLMSTQEGGKKSLQDWPTVKEFLQSMDEAEVDKAILLGWYWQHQETCIWHNEHMSRWIQQYPDRFSAFACIQPLAQQSALDELKRRRDQGFVGIGEVFHKVQGFSMQNETWCKILEWAQDNHMPINLHVTEPVGHDYKGKVASPLEECLALAKSFPKLKIILAHWGGLLPYYELNPYCRKILKNVYYDTAASPLLYDMQVFKSVVDIVGAEKVLFGSDYPLKLYPKMHRADMKTYLSSIQKESGLITTQWSAIAEDNIQKLIRLNRKS